MNMLCIDSVLMMSIIDIHNVHVVLSVFGCALIYWTLTIH